jgi:hypothetical protein
MSTAVEMKPALKIFSKNTTSSNVCAIAGSVATAIAGVFANFTNKIGKITGELEDVDKTKSSGVSCQY